MDAQGQTPAPAENLPLNPDLMGYPTVEALVQAKRASDQEAQRIIAERDALKTQLQYVYQPVNQRQDVKQRGTVEERLIEAGIPVEDVRELARSVANEMFQPVLKSSTARNTMLGRYPDYNKFEADVARHIESNPELQQTFAAIFDKDPVAGFEYAFMQFGKSRNISHQQTQEMTTQAAVHAGIPSGRNGEARRSDQNSNSNIQKAWERYQQTGSKQDAERVARERLHSIVSDEHLNA